MRYYRALLSALTLFGGHFLNRRIDRVVLVLGMLTLIAITAYVVLPNLLFGSEGVKIEWIVWLTYVPAVMVGGTALVSAALTWWDAGAGGGPPLSVATRLAGGIISIAGLLVVSSFLLTRLLPSRESAVATRDDVAPSTVTVHQNFHSSVHLGGRISGPELSDAPRGPHMLRGRIILDDGPVEGLDVYLYLNEEFKTSTVRTNQRGEFEVALPAGAWRVNRVTITDWDDAPEDRFLMLFSPFEPRKGDGHYSRYRHDNDVGFEVQLPASPATEVLTLELRDSIRVNWPDSTPIFQALEDGASIAPAQIEDAVIRWQPVPSAAEYEIQINSVTRQGRGMSYTTIVRRRQPGQALALAALPRQPADGPTPGEYLVNIFAFDSEGRLLTQSDDQNGELLFRLAGAMRIAEEREPPLDLIPGGELSSAEYIRNMERLSLISGLLDHSQLDAARALLDEVTEDAPPGRKLALEGALAALQGDCAKAVPLFDKAVAAGGPSCAQPKYRSLCEASPPP